MEELKLTRQELYDLVWTEPMSTLAKNIRYPMWVSERNAENLTYQYPTPVIGPRLNMERIRYEEDHYYHLTGNNR